LREENPVNINGSSLANHLKAHKYPYILIALTILINITIIRAMIIDWYYDANYSHGFLVIPVSIFLFFRKRKELIFPARPSRWGILLTGLGCFGLILGIAASEYFTTRFSLIMIITGISLYYLGNQNFRKVWFAFVFLLFMVPIPAVIYYSATVPMQLFASGITDRLLQIMGVPAVRQGNVIYLPQYTLEVVEACSGLRSLVSLLALSGLYGYLALPGKARPVILFLGAIPIAIAINIFRLVLTAVGAYAISTEVAESFLHQISGLLVFVVALILLIVLGAILKWPKKHL
jgi:exosortase